MNKTIAVFGTHLVLAVSLLAAPALSHEKHHDESQKGVSQGVQTLEGELLDMACYMAHEGKGPKHKKCAQMCLDGGAPAGLLTKEGRVYLLVENHNNPKPYQELRKKGAEQVKVKGEVFSRGGVQAIVIQ